MRRRDLIRAALTTPLASWLPPLFPRSVALAAEPGVNAATVYRAAFAWAQSLQSEDHARLRVYATVSLDDRDVRELLKRSGPALRALRQGADLAECRWEVEALSSADLTKEHLNVHGNSAIRAACLSARVHAREGREREALEDLFAGLTLSHRVGSGGVLIARMLECSGEVAVFQTLGRLLPDLGHTTFDVLAHRLDLLPPPDPASATIGPEARFIKAVLRHHLEEVGPKLGVGDWKGIGLEPNEIESLRLLVGDDRDALLAHLEATGPAFAELARRLDLPRQIYRESLDEFARRHQATDPIVAGLVEDRKSVV